MFDYITQHKDLAHFKDVARQEIFENVIINTISQIIAIDNFPKETRQEIAILYNLINGKSALIKKDGKYYVAECIQIGLSRNDGYPHKVRCMWVTEDGIKTGEFTNGIDCVVWFNTTYGNTDYNIERFAHKLAENDKSIDANVKFARLSPLVRVKNEVEKAQIEKALSTEDGNISTYISDDTFSDIINEGHDVVLNVTNVKDSQYIQYLDHYKNSILDDLYNLYGLDRCSTGKMAEQTEKEISGRALSSFMLPENMLSCAKRFCEDCKVTFGLEMTAHYGRIHELSYNKLFNDCTKDNTENGDACEENINVSHETLKEGSEEV